MTTNSFLNTISVIKDKPEVGFSIVKTKISTDLEDNEVLIKVIYASFCGTDYHLYKYDDWAKNRIKLPITVGHEFCGSVIKVGKKVSRVRIGDIVSAETHIICHKCEFCLRGDGHICENTKIIGVDTEGCFSNYVKIPEENCFVNSKEVNPLYLSVQEPLGNAVHTLAHFDIINKDVAIVGCGPIGLMGIAVAKAYNAKKIIAIEVNQYRRDLALKLGADVVINPLEVNVIDKVMELTNNLGVDVVGEFSGNKVAIESSFKYIKKGGGMSLLGIPSKNIEIDLANDIVFKGISIYGVTGRRIYDTWYKVKDLIDSNKLPLDLIVTHIMQLSKINEASEIMGSGNCGKIVLIPEVVDE